MGLLQYFFYRYDCVVIVVHIGDIGVLAIKGLLRSDVVIVCAVIFLQVESSKCLFHTLLDALLVDLIFICNLLCTMFRTLNLATQNIL